MSVHNESEDCRPARILIGTPTTTSANLLRQAASVEYTCPEPLLLWRAVEQLVTLAGGPRLTV